MLNRSIEQLIIHLYWLKGIQDACHVHLIFVFVFKIMQPFNS